MKIPYSEASFLEQVVKGDTTATRLFLSSGMSPNLRTRDGRSVLSLAALMGRTDVAEILLSEGADINARDVRGSTALAHGAAAGHVEVVRLLLDRGADPNARDVTGQTPLVSAALMGRTAVAKLLLGRGADPGAKNPGGRTALDYARTSSSIEIVELLIRTEITAGHPEPATLQSAVDLRLGMEAYRRGDFERASQFFARADSAGEGKAGARAMLLKTEESSYAWATVSAQSKESAAPLQDFLRRYPSGTYAQKARELLPMIEDLEIQARFERRKADYRARFLAAGGNQALQSGLSPAARALNGEASRWTENFAKSHGYEFRNWKGVVDTLLISGERREIRILSDRHGLPVRYRSFDDSEMGNADAFELLRIRKGSRAYSQVTGLKVGDTILFSFRALRKTGRGMGSLSVSESEAMMQPEFAVMLLETRRTGGPGLRK